VYVLAISNARLTEKPFSWCREIVYVGMTNVDLAARLFQFHLTISGRRLAHGGADRFRYEYRDYKKLERALFVAVHSVARAGSLNLAGTLRVMGEVARLEYLCLARYAESFGVLPRFNDKVLSPKYSAGTRHR
jgi:hypothetical protein